MRSAVPEEGFKSISNNMFRVFRYSFIKFVEKEEVLLTDEVDKLQPKEKKRQ